MELGGRESRESLRSGIPRTRRPAPCAGVNARRLRPQSGCTGRVKSVTCMRSRLQCARTVTGLRWPPAARAALHAAPFEALRSKTYKANP